MDHGVYTGEMGRRLYDKYAKSIHQIYYDHGKDQSKEPHFCQPTPFFDECSSATTLSHVDVVVLNQPSESTAPNPGNEQNQTIELAAEIEESGHEPKKIIGDVVNLLMADAVRINGKDYPFGELVLVLGIRVDENGSGKDKVEALARKLMEMNEKLGKRKTRIVTVFHGNVERLVEEVAAEIERQLAAL